MAAPKLIADYANGEGKVEFPDDWKERGALLRADILKDWIYDLTNEYNTTVALMQSKPEASKPLN